MTLNSSGPISLGGTTAGQSIQIELGMSGTATVSLNDATLRTLSGTTAGTQVSLGTFYSKSNRIALSYTFTTSTSNASLNVTSIGGYISGKSDITVTVNSGVYLWASTTGNYGLVLSGGNTGDTLTLVNNGYIIGCGGTGDYSGLGPGAGGPALSLGFNTTINNTYASAYIAGGGGGGARTMLHVGPSCYPNSVGGGGAGGGAGGTPLSTYQNAIGSGGPGGGIGASGSPGGTASYGGITATGGGGGGAGGGGGTYTVCAGGCSGMSVLSGGGGGGRILPGTGGAGGSGTLAGGAGGSGTGAGGAGNTIGGGGGGGWAATGGGTPYAGGAGGGKAVALNGKTVTWVSGNTTRVYGAVS